MLSLILTCLLSPTIPLPLFEGTPPDPVEVVGSITLSGQKYKITNYTDMKLDGIAIGGPKDVPSNAVATRISVSEKGYVTHLWFSTDDKDK